MSHSRAVVEDYIIANSCVYCNEDEWLNNDTLAKVCIVSDNGRGVDNVGKLKIAVFESFCNYTLLDPSVVDRTNYICFFSDRLEKLAAAKHWITVDDLTLILRAIVYKTCYLKFRGDVIYTFYNICSFKY